MRRLFRFKKKEDENFAGNCQRTARAARTIWTKMKPPFLSEVIAESMWRALGWACHPKPHADLTSLRHAFEWRSTQSWQDTKAINMEHDPYNHARWKHTWNWHNRVCVWDIVASEWAGKEEWSDKKQKRCFTDEVKTDFITFGNAQIEHRG